MLTSITETDKKNIRKFIKGIDKGPFKHLNDKTCTAPQSEYVVTSSKEKSIYLCAVEQAWLDTCRTATITENNRAKLNKSKKLIAKQLEEYFNGKAKDKVDAFDGWYGSVLSEASNHSPLTVGQVQKLINMSFKYLICCEDIRDSRLSHFSCCHMPLDANTAEWLGLEGLKWSKINDTNLYWMLVEYSRSKIHGNLLLNEFPIWQKMTSKKA